MTTAADYTLTTSIAARLLGVSHDAVAAWADNGKLPCLRTPGGHRRFRRADLDAFAHSMLGEPTTEPAA